MPTESEQMGTTADIRWHKRITARNRITFPGLSPGRSRARALTTRTHKPTSWTNAYFG